MNLFAVLYDRHAKTVFNKCLGFANSKEEAQDLTHDIFVQLFVKLRTFKGTSKFSTWLYALTYNFCVNYVTRNKYKKNEKIADSDDELLLDDKEDESEAILMEIKYDKLQTILNKLELNDRIILLMKYQDDFSIKDIQDAIELSESAVKMRLKRAREKVIEAYKNIN
jgi:RNA polymerase sigma-70 factor (ECF subfamily)